MVGQLIDERKPGAQAWNRKNLKITGKKTKSIPRMITTPGDSSDCYVHDRRRNIEDLLLRRNLR